MKRTSFKMMTCREAAFLLSKSRDTHVDLSTRLALRLHVLLCRGCAHAQKQMQLINRGVQGLRSMDFVKNASIPSSLSDTARAGMHARLMDRVQR